MLKMQLFRTDQGEYDANNDPTLWIAHFRFSDSPDEKWERAGDCDVTAVVTDGFATVGLRDKMIAECKDYVQNKNNYAGQANYGNKFDAETWA